MKKLLRHALAALLVVSFLASSASAFDGQRKGFVLGGGLGLGGTRYAQRFSGGGLTIESSEKGSGALATTFKIGVGLDDRTLLIFQQNQNWFHYTLTTVYDLTLASGAGVIAVNYYLSEEGSAYLVAGLGVGSWSAPFEDDDPAVYGGALLIGAGIEFAPHWSVEFNLSATRPNDTFLGVKAEAKTTNVSVTVVGLAY